jgi:hypothetical protein
VKSNDKNKNKEEFDFEKMSLLQFKILMDVNQKKEKENTSML